MKPPATEPNGGKPAVSEMRSAIELYTVDRGSLNRSYPVAISPARRERFRKFYNNWFASLEKLDFDSMSHSFGSLISTVPYDFTVRSLLCEAGASEPFSIWTIPGVVAPMPIP